MIRQVPGVGPVQFPDTMPEEEVAAAVLKLSAQANPLRPAQVPIQSVRDLFAPGLLNQPKGFYGPGILANVGSRIQQLTRGAQAETPQQAYDRSVPAFETVANIAGGMVAPGRTFLQRLGSSITVPAALKAFGGGSASDITKEGLIGGATQSVVDAILGVARQRPLKKAAEALLETHTKAVTETANVAAAKAMDYIKGLVPEWKGLPSSVDGLVDAVLGRGQQLVSDMYDKAMAAAVTKAKGIPIALPVEDVGKLGLNFTLPSGLKRAKTFVGDVLNPAEDLKTLQVDAGDVIEALTKPGAQRDWRLYRRTVKALDGQDLGIDPAARSAYKNAMGFIDAIDSTKAIQGGEGGVRALDTKRLLEGMNKVDNIDILRDRGMGGISSELAERNPLIRIAEEAVAPPEPKIGAIALPSRERSAMLGAGLAGLGGWATGMGLHPGAGITGAGGLAGYMRPDKIYTSVPGTESLELLLGLLAKAGGVAARTGADAMSPSPATAGPLAPPGNNLDPAALAAFLATLPDNPGATPETGGDASGLSLSIESATPRE